MKKALKKAAGTPLPRQEAEDPTIVPNFALLAEASSDAYFRLDFSLGFSYVSRAFAELTGREPDTVLLRPALFLELIHPDDLQSFQAAMDSLQPDERLDPPLVLRFMRDGSEAVWVELFMVPVVGAEGKITGVDGIARDVSQHLQVADLLSRKTREQAVLLQVQQELLAQLDLESTLDRIVEKAHDLLEATSCALFLLEPDHETLTPLAVIGEFAQQLYALRVEVGEGIIGWVVRHAIPERVDHSSADARGTHVPGLGEEDRSILCAPLQVGDQVTGAIWLVGRPEQYGDSDLDFLVALAQVASLAIANSQLFYRVQKMATLDGLTGAFNRNFLDANLVTEITRAQRLGDSVGLYILDVDQLKLINDEHGHLVGDQVLKCVVQTLLMSLRETDWVARYGGDEFAIVLPGCPVERLESIGQKLHQNLSDAKVGLDGGGAIGISVTLGGAVFPDTAADAQGLIRAADESERAAKRAGGARVLVRLPEPPSD